MRINALMLLALALGSLPTPTAAQISAAPDITVDLSGVVVDDHQVAIDDRMGSFLLQGFGGLTGGVEVDAYQDHGQGTVFFSLDTTVWLGQEFAGLGNIIAGPEDLVGFDGATYWLAFDGSANGIPNGVNLDAVTRVDALGALFLSFDTSVTLGGVTYDDEDLVAFDGSRFSPGFDASAAGFDPALDLDAVDSLGGGVIAISFDGYGSHAGIAFADEDVLRYDPAAGSTTMLFDGSAAHPGWSDADLGALDVLPEPGLAAGLFAGVTLAAFLGRVRRGRRAVAEADRT